MAMKMILMTVGTALLMTGRNEDPADYQALRLARSAPLVPMIQVAPGLEAADRSAHVLRLIIMYPCLVPLSVLTVLLSWI